MARQRQQSEELGPAVRRGRFRELTLYEISAEELEILARGSADSLLLNFAIFLLSVAITLLVALLTTNIASDRLFAVFVIITVLGFICGAVLLAFWIRSRKSVFDLVENIKKRLPPVPPQGVPEGAGAPAPQQRTDDKL